MAGRSIVVMAAEKQELADKLAIFNEMYMDGETLIHTCSRYFEYA